LTHLALVDEPRAIVAGGGGDVFVVTTQPQSVVRINPTDGHEVGRVQLESGGPPGPVTINPADDTLIVATSSERTVAVVPGF
jgi:sugar lactone lactonase YvrE